jgi:uracil-DNA glycosylase
MAKQKDPHEFTGELPAGALAEPSSAAASPRDRLRRLALTYGTLLGEGATQIVPGEGNPHADLVLIGEAPGEEEDRQGRPFVGRSGKLLDQVLATAGLDRRELWITNTVKSRPVAFETGRAKNRAPLGSEIKAWRPCLEAELKLIQPKVLVGLGAVAGKALVDPKFKITQQRGEWYTDTLLGVDVLITWHPSYILRQVGEDYRSRLAEAIADFQRVQRRLLGKE